MSRDLGLHILLAAVCLVVGYGLEFGYGVSGLFGFTVIGTMICLAANLPPLGARAILEKPENGAVFPILTVAWRSAVVLIPIVWAAATKWPEVKSFSLTILGCYFPFLVLESALSIIRLRRDSGPTR